MAEYNNYPVEKKPKRVVGWVEDHPKSMLLLRACRRRAAELNTGWALLYVQTTSSSSPGEEGAHERVMRLLSLAEETGGEIIHIQAATVPEGICQFLEKEKN